MHMYTEILWISAKKKKLQRIIKKLHIQRFLNFFKKVCWSLNSCKYWATTRRVIGSNIDGPPCWLFSYMWVLLFCCCGKSAKPCCALKSYHWLVVTPSVALWKGAWRRRRTKHSLWDRQGTSSGRERRHVTGLILQQDPPLHVTGKIPKENHLSIISIAAKVASTALKARSSPGLTHR